LEEYHGQSRGDFSTRAVAGPCGVDASSPYRAVGVFVIVGYLTLINSWVRNALVGLLSAFKREAQ